MKIIITLILSVGSVVANASPFVLEKEYVNHAWGYQHSVCAVDENGHVYVYSMAGGQPMKVLRKVDKKEVDGLFPLIAEASKETFTSTHAMFDAGVHTWIGHFAGEKVVLKEYGDYQGMNPSAAAATLVETIDLWCSVK